MKNIFLAICGFAVCFTISSCKKTDANSGIHVNAQLPAITTNAAVINGSNISLGGNITSDGGSIVTEAGICYSTQPGVDTSKNKMATYPISGNFSIPVKGLGLLTTYYYKAYAINEEGITYGDEKSFLVPIPGYNSSADVAKANLVAYWAFDGGYIDSVSSTVGTPVNPSAISFVSGQRGQAAEIVSPGYINSNVGNMVSGLEDVTLAFWMKHPSTVDPSGEKFTYFPFSLNAAGFSWENTRFFMLINNPDNSTNSYGKVGLNDQWFDKGQTWPKLLDGAWHQVIISFSGSTGLLKVYVDGTFFNSISFSTQTSFGDSDSFTLGGPDTNATTSNGWMQSLNGDLDEFKIFNKVLSDDEVAALYTLQSHGF